MIADDVLIERDDKIECCGELLRFYTESFKGWEAYKQESTTCPNCKTFFERKPGSRVAYRQVMDKRYECTSYGAEIMARTVAHPIWDGPFPCSGSGKGHYEHVPYCPNCEERPSPSGIPIEIG